jgi:hypothetical protein
VGHRHNCHNAVSLIAGRVSACQVRLLQATRHQSQRSLPRVLHDRLSSAKKVTARSRSAAPKPATPAAAMATATTPAASADAKHADLSARQVALIGLAGVLVSAVFSILTGLVTANLAGASAARVTSQQLSGETEKSRAEFLRGQRQVLYSKIIADQRRLRDSETAMKTYLSAPPKQSTDEDVSNNMKNTRSLLYVFFDDVAVAEIVASEDVTQEVRKLRGTHTEICDDLDLLISQGPDANDLRNRLGGLEKIRVETIRALYKSARKDMGAE